MKAAAFDYCKPRAIGDVFELLKRYGPDARIMAGGQTLVATLNMRLSDPKLLIDITGLPDLSTIERRGDRLYIGALVTHTSVEQSPLVVELAPMLASAAPHIAHRAIRNSGTWGGSIAYGDPAAEWPCCLVALDGTVHVQGPAGQRQVKATDFFQDLYTTDLHPDEIVIGADVPVATTADWFGFDELARRHGDYAVAGLAVAARFEGRKALRVNLGLLGMGVKPMRAPQTEGVLAGKVLDAATVEIAAASLKAELDPLADLTHSADTKRHLASVLLKRLLQAADASRAAVTV
ncbi:MAG: xanthine dehydrogenase family protein subunit M [Betaproteobacteria bacterium]|nr:xanthine dehydrogenase family protein subunit M [Betaproteobacteria bacterium]